MTRTTTTSRLVSRTKAAPVFRTAAEEAAHRRRWIALLLLSLSLTLIIIDSTIVNIAFPAIRRTFSASFADAEWVNSIYSLVFGALLITWGTLGDQYGRCNIFVGGTMVFVLGSLGSGFAPTIALLVLSRAVQGLGAAMLSPSTLSIVSSAFQGRERGIAFGIWGGQQGLPLRLGLYWAAGSSVTGPALPPIRGGWPS